MGNADAENYDKDAFLALSSEVIESLASSGNEDKALREFDTWYKKVLNYNLLGGKMNLGMIVVEAYSSLAEKEDLTEENIRLAHLMGWCNELLQAACFVTDDIMDCSKTRKGQPCWYLTKELGPKAFNDALIMERAAFHILWKYHREQTYYNKCVELFNEVIFKIGKGQSLSILTSSRSNPQLDLFTEERYATIVKYKTSYHFFIQPIKIAMIMAGIQDQDLYSEAESVLFKIGHLFQVQEDYMDCFGDPEVTGNGGTDIEEGKCTWLVVTALKHADHHQRVTLEEYYGSKDPKHVSRVKNLYRDIGLLEIYKEFEENSRDSILEEISSLKNPNMQRICKDFLDRNPARKR